MKEIVDYILKNFNLTFDDIKPFSRPNPNQIRARIMISVFLKYKNYKSQEIAPFLHTTDVTGIHKHLKKFNETYLDLHPLMEQMKIDFQHIPSQEIGSIKCKRCGNKKSQNNYKKYTNGKFRTICKSCDEINILHPKTKKTYVSRQFKECKNCNAVKDKLEYRLTKNGAMHKFCLVCEAEKQKEQQQITLLNYKKKQDAQRNKKDDLVVNSSPDSYETKKRQQLTAEEALKRAKEHEQQLLNNGAKYIKNGIRAFVLTK